MPYVIAAVIYALLFISGTALSNNIPKSTPTPTPTSQSGVLSASTSDQSHFTTLISDSPTPSVQVLNTNKVIKVIDGDTIQVNIEGKTESIRLIGIDTPETVDPRTTVQCFGMEASNKSKELLTGKNVLLEADSTQGERDIYNRLLRYIFLEDGTNVNKLMILEGFAHEYTYQSNPYKYQNEFKLAETEARENKRGLWADNACPITPKPTIKPTAVPTKYIAPTHVPTLYIAPTNPPSVPSSNNSGGSWTCNCSKTCPNISSCDEAQYLLNVCGCGARDGDKDGIACDGAPLHCQN